MLDDTHSHLAEIPLVMSISVRRPLGKGERSPPPTKQHTESLIILFTFFREETIMPVTRLIGGNICFYIVALVGQVLLKLFHYISNPVDRG